MTPETLTGYARSWLDVPFRHQGRTRTGVDCAGFLVELLRAAGCLPPEFVDVRAYGRRPQRELRDNVETYCTREPNGWPHVGVLVLIKWPGDLEPSHVAYCTGPTLIHSYQAAGRVVEHGFRGPWARDADSYWRMPGVRYE